MRALAAALLLAACPASPPDVDDAGVADAGELGALGAACLEAEDCASGLCGYPSSGCAINECPAVGERCDGSTFCTGGPCGQSCEPTRLRGEQCLAFSDDGVPCRFAAVCADGLVCGVRGFQGKFGSGDCVPAVDRTAGEPCGDDVNACAAGLACDDVLQECE